jgi:hypothetical protein
VSPDGKYLYSTNTESFDISAFSIDAAGSLKKVPKSPFDTGHGAIQIAVTPDQGPVAQFSAAPTPAGNPVPFDASGSFDPDGAIASYRWDFGDGHTEVTSTATAAHVYETPDDYTVTLTLVDDSGCSTAQTFTGQTVSCNGSSLAQASHQVAVPPGEPLSVSTTGSGSGSVISAPAGIACPGACAYHFEPGTPVVLTPVPAPGSAFAGWSEGDCAGGDPCELTLNEASVATAVFDQLPPPPGPEGGSGGEILPPPSIGFSPPAPAPAHLRILRVRGRNGVVVGGSIAAAARGAVRVKASAFVDGRRVGVSRRARIVRGRWRANLRLSSSAAPTGVTLFLTVRFPGSPGVQGDQAKRRVRGLPAT